MESTSQQYKTLGPVGGPGSSAQAGGFVSGPIIAGQGGVRGDSGDRLIGNPKPGGDVRNGGHFGPTTSAAPAASGYAQGDQFAMDGGISGAPGNAPKGALATGVDARTKGAGAASASGVYNQGMQLAAKTK